MLENIQRALFIVGGLSLIAYFGLEGYFAKGLALFAELVQAVFAAIGGTP